MAHPDPNRSGSEKGQREHTGKDSEATDAGLKSHSQSMHGAGPTVIQDTDPAADRGQASADTRVGDLDERSGRVAPGERSDRDGPLPDGGMARDSGAGAAGGRDAGGGSARDAGASGRNAGPQGGTGTGSDRNPKG